MTVCGFRSEKATSTLEFLGLGAERKVKTVQLISGLVEGVDGQAAEEFGVEVGGFLRHDVAGERDVAELVESDWPDEEGDVGFAHRTTTLAGLIFSPALGSSTSAADGLAVKTTWDASARGRLGFLVTPATLLYVTGGAAWQHFEVTSTCASANTCGAASNGSAPAVIANSATKAGWTVGGGIETALSGHWFARGEYRYADFGSSAFTLNRSSTNGFFSPVIDNFSSALRTHTATLGLAYKFGDPVASGNSGGGASPVKASPLATTSWSGLYAGLGLGMRASRTDATTRSETIFGVPKNLTGLATGLPFDGTAFRTSPYAGYKWQIAPQWVAGIDGDVGFADQTTTLAGFTFSPAFGSAALAANGLAVRTSWDASARGRLGFLVTPTTLLYATGGAAWQHYDVTSTCASAISCVGVLTPTVIANSTTRAGLTVGGGIETALWGHWLARGEYRYADFGSSAFTLNRSVTGLANPIVDNFNVALRTHTATLGLAYKFDNPGGR